MEQSTGQEKVVASLTTIPSRLEFLHVSLESIFNQTVMPEKVILYIGDDVDLDQIPDTVKVYQDKGLFIEKRPGNLRSHKKYYYACQEYPDHAVITFDDDWIYPPTMVASLIETYRKYPDCVSSNWVMEMKRNEDGQLLSFQKWGFFGGKAIPPSLKLRALSGSGMILPPSILPQIAFDADTFMELSPTCDESWLKIIETINGIHTAGVKIEGYIKEIAEQNKNTLWSVNYKTSNANFCRVMKHFQVEESAFFKE